MNILFRTDASDQIGTGHVMRCLSLAHELKRGGAQVGFICRSLPNDLCNYIEGQGFVVHALPFSTAHPRCEMKNKYEHWVNGGWENDAYQTGVIAAQYGKIDWLIVDHYGLERHWEAYVHAYTDGIMAIDDLADREHQCEMLLDQSFFPHNEQRYKALVPDGCKMLLGPAYALLRDEFMQFGHRVRDGIVRRVLVFYGGIDATNETSKAINALEKLNRLRAHRIHADVVVGRGNPHKQSIELQCETLGNVSFHCQISNMAELMYSDDLALGAGGSTTWERCAVGLPTIITSVAENQIKMTQELERFGGAWHLGWYRDVSEHQVYLAIKRVLENPAELRAVGETARRIMGDGLGTRAVCEQLMGGRYANLQ